MRTVWPIAILITLMVAVPVRGQVAAGPTPVLSDRFRDPVEGLTLERAIAQALEREPGLQADRQEIEIARGARTQAGLRANPSVSFDWRTEPGGTDRQATLGVEWPLDLFRRTGRVAVAERQVAVAGFTIADRERLVVESVRNAFSEVLAGVRDLGIFDELVALADRQLALVRARVDEGAAPPLERDRALVEMHRLEADRLLQSGRVETMALRLRRLLGLSPATPLRMRDTLETLVAGDTGRDELPSADVDKRPDVRQAAEQVNAADARIDLASREGRFDLSLYGSYARMDAGFPQTGFGPTGTLERVRGQFHYFSGGLTMQLPLLDRRQGDRATALAERGKAAATHAAVRLTAEHELAAAREQLRVARQALDHYATAGDALASQNLAVATETYALGRGSILDVVNEQRRYLDLQRARTEALRAVFDAHTALKAATGEVQ